ncbi:MAG: helix-turn-helix domain-containing protein [Armatimonadetes bacterium]|nr:helix-turn-helix domain-containing protein [Armatimonadota bacterium]NIO75516.1 helix-turn-helix domain-containing protein [Armatimonadota bacterium]NIO95893.1 helix-turn-helix domain-containing protein [Armatimonadota bacterium]
MGGPEMDIYRRIGERIRHARSRAGLTQPQLARLLNVSKGIISRWETGLARPSLDRLEPLARRLEISLEAMLGFTGVEETGGYPVRGVPVWEMASEIIPDFKPTSCIGATFVSEEEALAVQAALLIPSDCFCPYFFTGDVVGVQTAGRAKLGEIVFIRKNKKVALYCYGGRKKGDILLPMGVSQRVETVARIDLVGIFRWLHRPGKVISRG